LEHGPQFVEPARAAEGESDEMRKRWSETQGKAPSAGVGRMAYLSRHARRAPQTG